MNSLIRNILVILAFSLVIAACSNEKKIENTAIEHIRKQMKDPESLKIESIEVFKDTIPVFLNNDILSATKKTVEAMKEFSYYSEKDDYLWYSEKRKSAQKFGEVQDNLKALTQSALDAEPVIEYVAIMKCSGKNSYGGTASSKHILIFDKNNPEKIIGEFDIDSDFMEKYIAFKMSTSPNSIKQNQFGKFETDNMPKIEQFILSE